MRGLRRVPAAILLACGAALALGGAARAAITDPTDISGLQLWLDAQDVDGDGNSGNDPADGASLATWVDKSTNGRDLSQGTAGDQPLYRTNQLSGYPVVMFDGANDRLSRSGMSMPAREIFAVAMARSTIVGNDGLLSRGVNDDLNIRAADNTAYRGDAGHATDGNDFVNGVGGAISINEAATDSFTADVAHRLDALAANDKTFTDFVAGDCRLTAWRPWDGYIAEIIVYDHALTAGERADVAAYLTAKWWNAAPSVSWNVPPSPTAGSYPSSSDFTLSVDVSDSDGTVTGVSFYYDTTNLIGAGTDSTPDTWTFDWNTVTDGQYALTAVATDNEGGTGTSSSVDIVVGTVVTVDATDAAATEGAPADVGVFRINRLGSLTGDITVTFAMSGAAQQGAGLDYLLDSTSPVFITDGVASVDITLTTEDDPTGEPDEDAIITLTGGTGCAVGSPASAAVTIRDDDIVAWYRLDHKGPSDTTAYDETANHFDGTLTGGPTWTATAQVGPNALDFDGTGDHYVETGKTATELGIGGNNTRTVALWCYTRAFSGGGLFSVGPASTGNQICLRALAPSENDGTDNSWRLQNWGGAYDFNTDTGAGFTGGASSGIVSLDNWVHFAHVHDGTNTYIYINGDLKITWAHTLDTTDDVTCRLGYYDGTSYYNGILDDVRIYNRALSGPEVQEIFNYGNVKVSPDSGLVTTEDAGSASHTATFTVVLGSAPAADVTVDVSSSDTGEGVIEGATAGVLTLVFTPSDWGTPRTISVTGVDDDFHDLHVPYTVDMAVSSTDAEYDCCVRSAGVTNRDDEFGTNLIAWYRLDGGEDLPSITSSAPTTALKDDVYVYNIAAYGLPAPMTLDVDIPPPADTWLTFDTATNTLSGTPTVTGPTGDITVTAANALGSVQQVFPITIIDPVVGDGLFAEYWDAGNADMGTAPDASRVDAIVDFPNGWNGDVPSGINIDSFTVRWTGMVKADETGSHRFEVEHDDGASLWVNGVKIIDNYGGGGTHSGTIDLAAGELYSIELHFTDTGGGEKCHLRWEPPSPGEVVVPQANLSSTSGTPPAPPVIGASPELIAEDSVGGNDGTLTNMTGLEWREGRIVGALEFDGTNDYVDVPDLGFSGNVSLSFAAWIWVDPSAGNDNIFGFGRNGTNNQVFSLRTNGSTQFHLYFWNNDLSATVGSYYGTWVHVAGVWDSATSTRYIYFNGAEANSSVAATMPDFQDMNYRIGGFNNEYFLGLIDDARIYDRALTGPEVQGLYERSFTTVMPTYGLVTNEDPAAADHTATFMVWLGSAPAADVTISLSSSDTGEGTIDGAASNVLVLTFTPSGPGAWYVPQTVTVTGFDEDIDDGDATYEITLSPTSSTDASFDGLDVADVWLINTDDDTAGVTVTPTTALVTTEAGAGTATFTVVLTSEPAGPVTVDVESSDTAEGTVTPAQLVFTSLTWNSPRTVLVTGVDDFIDDIVDNMPYDIFLTVSSADAMYVGFFVQPIEVTNIDDDTAGITVSAVSVLTTSEGGGTDTFTVKLDSEPTTEVTVAVSSSDTGEGTIDGATLNVLVLTFTPSGPTVWNTPQVVTVTGVDDNFGDGDIDYTVLFGAASSADGFYSGRQPADIAAISLDDEPVVYIDTAVPAPDAQEEATSPVDTLFTVVRESRTGNPVTVDVPVSFTVGGTAVRGVTGDYVLYADATPIADATTGFTIPAGGVSLSVIIYVKPQDDDLGEGPESVIFSLLGRADGRYYAVEGPSTDAATILDDEPVVTVAASVPLASEPAVPGEFTVTRTTAFRADEAFDIHFTLSGTAASGADYVTIPPSPVRILSNESSATVTVVPLDDRRQEGDETVTLVIVRNGALGYTVGSPGQATVTIADDERPGIGGGTGCASGPAPAGAAGAAWGLVCLAAAALVRRRAGKASQHT